MTPIGFRLARDPERALTYEAYKQGWKARLESPMKGLDKTARKYLHYTRYNWEREERVWSKYTPSDQYRKAVLGITEPQVWLVLTEDWCADSAYSLPVLVTATRINPDITLRILLRDANLDVMDQYLTNGGRAIPKLIAFSENGEERFRWGSKPEALALLRARLKEEGAPGHEIVRQTIEWYENAGWLQVEEELTGILAGVRTA